MRARGCDSLGFMVLFFQLVCINQFGFQFHPKFLLWVGGIRVMVGWVVKLVQFGKG